MGLNPLNAILVATSLVLVSLNIGIGTYATDQVPAAVEEAVAMKAKDDICENVMCTEVNEDWKESTSQRDFYAWHITCLLYTSPSPRDQRGSRMPSSA